MVKELSLIIPSLNEGENLSMTIQSILETTTGAYEILVVDNGSTDGSADFIERVDDPRIRLFRSEERLGVAGARNYGAAFAEGEVLIFIDAHVLFSPNWLTPVLDVLRRENVGFVVPVVSAWGEPGAKGYGINWLDEGLEAKWQDKQSSEPYAVPLAGGCFQAFRADFFYQLGGYDGGMKNFGSEDLEICLHTWLSGYKVMLVPEVEISHRFRRTAPYPLHWVDHCYNFLRMVYAHFNEPRIERVLAENKSKPDFEEALRRVKVSDIWFRRRLLKMKRKYDDDWFFDTFGIKAIIAEEV